MLREILVVCLCLLLGASVAAEPVGGGAMVAKNLRCEGGVNPLGVGELRPRLSWNLSGGKDSESMYQSAYRVIVATSPALLAKGNGDLWDSGKVSSEEHIGIEYLGKPLSSRLGCYWKVQVWDGGQRTSWSDSAYWEMGLIQAQDWVGKWINDGKTSPEKEVDMYGEDPAPLFRKEFKVGSGVRRARLYISGLGYYEASLNAKKIGDEVLAPGWTKFDKRVGYRVFDVTSQLGQGTHCLGVILGNGWYNPLPLKLFGSFNLRKALAIGRPRFVAKVVIEYQNGKSETISTDESWKVGESPRLKNNIYLGEVVDARKEVAGWNLVGFDDRTWRKPGVAVETIGRVQTPSEPPVRVTAEWNAVKVTEPEPHVYVYDCGENFAGWVDLELDLPAGKEIHLRYGELLSKDGKLNPMTSVAGQVKGFRGGTQESVGGPGAPKIAWQQDTYITKGGKQVFQSKFSFHAFRFVEVRGLSQPLPIKSVRAKRLNSDVETVGKFECSNPMLNQIQQMCIRTFKSNIFSVQSDCPHRERLGYGGDIAATSEAFMANFDMSGFYAKAVRDWSDSALEGGMFTDTAPFMGIQYCGLIWAMAHPLLVDQLYQYYGDSRIGVEEYSAARKWLKLVETKYPDGIVSDGLSDHESLNDTPSPQLVTPMYFFTAKLMSKLAHRQGLKEDEAHCDGLAGTIQTAYLSRFVDSASGKVGPGTQSSQSIALYSGILPDELGDKAFAYMVADIEAQKGHLTTGILGTKYMLDILSQRDQTDLAYRIVTQPDFPGWGWMMKNGATTLWEHWAFSDNTFSHNHPMFGSVSQWMLQRLGGIRPAGDAYGFDKVIVEPMTPTGLDWVKSSYQSVRGKIVSNWIRSGSQLTFEVEVPANMQVEFVIPSNLVKGGLLGYKNARIDGGMFRCTLGAGKNIISVGG